jgi:hypothetical protein
LKRVCVILPVAPDGCGREALRGPLLDVRAAGFRDRASETFR